MNRILSYLQPFAGHVILFPGWLRLIVAFSCGLFASAGLAPYYFVPACFFSFSFLVWLLDAAVALRSASFIKSVACVFTTGWFFGAGYFSGIFWISQTGSLLGGETFFVPELFLYQSLEPVFLGLFFGLGALAASFFWSSVTARIMVLAIALGLSEGLRQFLYPDLSWSPPGFAMMPTPLFMQTVQVIGISGMNILAVFVFSMPAAFMFSRNMRRDFLLWSVVLAAHTGFGAFVLAREKPSGAASFLVRVVVSPRGSDIKKLQLLSEQPTGHERKPDLIVWPPVFLLNSTASKSILPEAGKAAAEEEVLVPGFVRTEPGKKDLKEEIRLYNSVALVNGKGKPIAFADKIGLIPFREYFPLGKLFYTQGKENLLDFTPGKSWHLFDSGKGLKFIACVGYSPVSLADIRSLRIFAKLIIDLPGSREDGSVRQLTKLHHARIKAVATGLPVLFSGGVISAMIDGQGYMTDLAEMRGEKFMDTLIPEAAW